MGYVSCGASQLYRAGGFYEDSARLAGLAGKSDSNIRLLRELFPPYSYTRKMPFLVSATDEDREALLSRYRSINLNSNQGAASALVELSDVVVARNVIYVKSGSQRQTVYETHRPTDRDDSPLIEDDARILPFPTTAGAIHFFLGSVGSFNYGHWLTDDIARVSALFALREAYPDCPIVIVLPSYEKLMSPRFAKRWNEVRVAAIKVFLRGLRRYSIRSIDTTLAYHFEKLYYATPISYHPVLKSPQALELAAERLSRPTWRFFGNCRSGERILVERWSVRGRVLQNMDGLRILLARHGFRTVDTERMSVSEQATIFRKAKIVVGVMGAGMANTLFCQPDTRLIYLAPVGWTEPYYWDLASLRNHIYAVCYGPRISTPGPAHMTSFMIPEQPLLRLLNDLS